MSKIQRTPTELSSLGTTTTRASGDNFFQKTVAAGGAWNAEGLALMANGMQAPNPVLTSFGFGIRSLALGLPLRFDVAWRQEPWGGTSAPVYLFSLGADF